MYEIRRDYKVVLSISIVATPASSPLGPELITNGDFADGAGWTLQGGAAIATGFLTLGGGPISRAIRTETAFPAGIYKISVDLLTISGTDVIIVAAGGQNFNIEAASPPGTYTSDLTLDGSGGGSVSINGFAANPGVQLDNLSLRVYL